MRVVELRNELLSYFLDQKFKLSDRIGNNAWLSRHTYLASIFKVR